jgi:signal transduction histidine kinase
LTESSAEALRADDISESEQRIRASKFDLLINQSSPTPVISMGMAALITFLLWDIQSRIVLGSWMLMILVTGAIRIRFFREYSKRRPTPDRIPRWEFFYRLSILAYFLAWGLGGLWVMPADSVIYQLAVLYFLMGLAGAAISVFSADRVSLMFAICSLLLPPLVWFAILGDPLRVVCALAGGVFLISASRSSGVFAGTITQNLELTERLAAEKERAESMTAQVSGALAEAREANDAKTRFFAAANHDLKQPIQALRVMSTVLGNRKLEGGSAEIVDSIQSSINTLSDQLDGFLEISKLDAGVTPVSEEFFLLDPLLTALKFEYSPLAATRNITISLACPANVRVYTDHVLLERIIRNLIGNALAHNSDCEVQIRVEDNDQNYHLHIADTGKGIPSDKQRLIFEEFYQLEDTEQERHGGLGLGLSIVQRLQALLGLNLNMESSEGTGTRFHMWVPKSPS